MHKRRIATGLFALAIAVFSASALAFDGMENRGQRGDIGPMKERMAERLDLSEEQIKQMREVRERHITAMREQMDEILTDEQLEQMSDFHKRKNGHWKHCGMGKGNGKGKGNGNGKGKEAWDRGSKSGNGGAGNGRGYGGGQSQG